MNALLAALLLADFAFIAIHWTHHRYDFLPSPLFAVDTDGGFAEWFQYVKEFGIGVLLLMGAAARRAVALFVSWAALFFFLLLDDALRGHERLAALCVRWLDLPNSGPGLLPKDWLEFVIALLAGAVLLVFILRSLRTAHDRARRASFVLFFLMFMLGLFGIAGDALHGAFERGRLGRFLTVIEDGGEMMVMSVTLWYVWRVVRQERALPRGETA